MTARTASAAAIVLAVAGALVPARAAAGTCTITSTSPVAFGAYDVFEPSAVVSTGSITYECTGVGEADLVRVDLDGGASGNVAARHLVAGALTLAYQLYLDAAQTIVWGDGTAGTSSYGPLRPAEGSTTLTVYGHVPAGQDAGAGAYADSVTVTLQF